MGVTMAIFWTALPMLLLLAVMFLDIYVFRGQWKDESQDSGGTQAIRSPEALAAAHHKTATGL
jgi:hypothetical protein